MGTKLRWLSADAVVVLFGASGCAAGAEKVVPAFDASAADTTSGAADAAEATADATSEAADATEAAVDSGPTCEATETVCGGACVDTQTSRDHCGACGKACAAGEVCSAGACSLSCGGGTVKCTSGGSSVCSTLASDPLHCGACGNACPARANAASVCASGTCSFACNAGYADCNAVAGDGCEAKLAGDVSNCGKCGNVSPAAIRPASTATSSR